VVRGPGLRPGACPAILSVYRAGIDGRMAGHESPAVGDAGMGKFVGGLLIGLLTGLIFADYVFPDGFPKAVEQLSQRVQSRIPGR